MKAEILIVDDEITLVTELEEILLSNGYLVVGTATSGAKAIELSAQLKPDLILMDIVIHGEIDGITAAERIKEHLGIPVIFLTGYADEVFVDRARNASPLGYLMKPFSEAQIVAAVKVALDKHEKECQIKRMNDELEERVKERNKELLNANRALQEEIVERERAWEALKMSEQELKAMAVQLNEANITLNVLLKKREKDKEDLEKKVSANIRSIVQPYLKEIKQGRLDQDQRERINVIEASLDEIGTSFSAELLSKHLSLTPGELRVAHLIRAGMKTKDIARLLSLSISTVEAYRKTLRQKLDIQNKNVNLVTYLTSIL
jgi:DNA-binding NarL/FixJ family response regulator